MFIVTGTGRRSLRRSEMSIVTGSGRCSLRRSEMCRQRSSRVRRNRQEHLTPPELEADHILTSIQSLRDWHRLRTEDETGWTPGSAGFERDGFDSVLPSPSAICLIIATLLTERGPSLRGADRPILNATGNQQHQTALSFCRRSRDTSEVASRKRRRRS